MKHDAVPPPTLKDIKKVYRAVALLCHPDKVSADATEAEKHSAQRRFDAATDAHDRLKEALEKNDLAAARHAQSATNELMASLKAVEITSPGSYVWKIFYNIVTPEALQAGEGRLPYLPSSGGIAAKLKEVGTAWCKKYAKETFVPHWCATMV